MTTENHEGELSSEERTVQGGLRALECALSTFEAAARARMAVRAPYQGEFDATLVRLRGEAARVAREAETYSKAAYDIAAVYLGAAVFGTEPPTLDGLERICRMACASSEAVIPAPEGADGPDDESRFRELLAQAEAGARELVELAEAAKALDLDPAERGELAGHLEEASVHFGTVLRVFSSDAPAAAPPPSLLMAQGLVDHLCALEPMIPREVRAEFDPAGAPGRRVDRASKPHRRKVLAGVAAMLLRDAADTAAARALAPFAVFLEAAFRFGADPRGVRDVDGAGVFLAAAERFDALVNDSARAGRPSPDELVDLALRCLGHSNGEIKSAGRKATQRMRDKMRPDRPRQNNGRGKKGPPRMQ